MDPLNDYETRIMSLLARGRTRAEVGNELGANYTGLGRDITRIHKKLGALNTTHAVAILMNGGKLSRDVALREAADAVRSVRVKIPCDDTETAINYALNYAALLVERLGTWQAVLSAVEGDQS